ncbi:hypothetical protein O6H91_18G033400 [Diphasiastrum complanatum]|uniref:Uncharacterized protein n=1 Tax=Diphasiastrum complanatum TaxID=34168 RepID=A0ACC2AZL5_DIPCM|nr:hypothetical protein O6H91_18G033400 [Diphasiastrum complanatum]
MISIRSYIGRQMQGHGLHDATGEQLDVRRWERMEMMRFWGMERDLGMGTRMSGWMRVIQRQRMRVSMRGGEDMQHLFVDPDAKTQEELAVPAPRRRGRPRRSRGGGGGLGALFVERTGVSQAVEGQVGSEFIGPSQSTRSQLRGRPGGSSRGGAVGTSQEGAGGRERGRGRGRGQGRGRGGRRVRGRGSPRHMIPSASSTDSLFGNSTDTDDLDFELEDDC